jgi:hypothetical protein
MTEVQMDLSTEKKMAKNLDHPKDSSMAMPSYLELPRGYMTPKVLPREQWVYTLSHHKYNRPHIPIFHSK